MSPGIVPDTLPVQPVLRSVAVADTTPALLVVDDDAMMLQTFECFCASRGFKVVTASNLADAKAEFLRRKSWTVVLSDYHLPDGNGGEFCAWVREQASETPFILMSGSIRGQALCGVDFLAKPFRLEALERRINAVLHKV
jgi:DNA-binding response OmpR family regulator